MSDLLIHNMKMPKSCADCIVGEISEYCSLWKKLDDEFWTARHPDCPITEIPDAQVDLSIFDVEETHYNCTVQVWKNSVTGQKSVGWKEEPKWISVEDQLPEPHTIVLVTDGEGITLGFLVQSKNNFGFMTIYATADEDEITHWFPLPTLPIK